MDPSFRRLWLGQSVSLVGSQVAQLALPLIAVVQLRASVASIALVTLIGYVPFVLLSVPVGDWVDRRPRRPVLVATNLARAALMGAVAVLAATRTLRMAELYAFSAVSGILGLLFVVAFRAAIPELVGPDDLVGAQSRLAGSDTVASIAGPGLGGLLIAAVSAPFALLADAASFAVAGAAARTMAEVFGQRTGQRRRQDLGALDGLRAITCHPLLRALAVEGAIANLSGTMVATVFVVFAVRDLRLGAGAIGLVTATGGFGALAGAVVARRLGERFDTGRMCLSALAVADLCILALPTVHGHGAAATVMLAPMLAVGGAATAVFEIHTSALTYEATPADQHGRTQAGMRFVGSFGLIGGAVVAGGVGQLLGIRVAILLAAGIGLCHWPVILRSPLSPRGEGRALESRGVPAVAS